MNVVELFERREPDINKWPTNPLEYQNEWETQELLFSGVMTDDENEDAMGERR